MALTSKKFLVAGFLVQNWANITSKNKDHLSRNSHEQFIQRTLRFTSVDDSTFKSNDIFFKELGIARLQIFPNCVSKSTRGSPNIIQALV